MQLKKLKLNDLHPYPGNPRRNDNAIEAVMESIRQCGYVAPIIVDENYEILAGHTRYKALRELGRAEAEVIIREGLTDEQKRKYRLLDNKTNELAGWDFDALKVELDGLGFEGLELDWGIDFLDDEKQAPAEFAEYDEDIATQHKCPMCGYEW